MTTSRIPGLRDGFSDDVDYTFFYSTLVARDLMLVTGRKVGEYLGTDGTMQLIVQTDGEVDKTRIFTVHQSYIVDPTDEVCNVCEHGTKIKWTAEDPEWPVYGYHLHGVWTKCTAPLTRQFMLTHGMNFNDIAVPAGMNMKMDDTGEPYMFVDAFLGGMFDDDPDEDIFT